MILVRIAVAAAVVLVVLVALVRLAEPSMAFFPTTGETSTPSHYGAPFGADTVTTSDGERLHAWTLPQQDAAALIVYFHGNGGNLSVWAPILSGVRARGYTVRAIDYRGYGLSTGRPSENGLYKDVDAALDWALRTMSVVERRAPIIYWGRSLGSTMAAYAATRRRPDGLILESGFSNVQSVVKGSALAPLAWLASYRFPTAEYGRQAGCPLLVIHGDADRVIPYSAGVALFDALPEPKRFVRIRGGDHNDETPADEKSYWSSVRSFVDGLPHRRSG